MKKIALMMILMLSVVGMSFATNNTESRDKNKRAKQTETKKNMDKEVRKHIFFPSNSSEQVSGQADVMFQVFPDGEVKVVMIQTKNPFIKKFIERQAQKMKVDSNTAVVGEIFRYRFTFKSDDSN
ncbi:MAG: hypothetical protein R2809_02200 [Flavobacteriales bacterium]